MRRSSPLLLSLLLLSCAACQPDERPAEETPDQALDMAPSEEMSPEDDDMGADLSGEDSGEDLGPDMEPGDLGADLPEDMPIEEEMGGLPTTCEGSCAEHSLTLTFGQETRSLSRAYYGLSSPESSINGGWELYLEAYEGGEAGCPSQASPSPDYSLLLTGVAIPSNDSPLTRADDGLNLVLFDFAGDLVPEPPFRSAATAVSVTPVALDVCEPCVGMSAPSHEAGFVSLDLEATFAEGSLSGHLYATHCDSLDAP